MTPEVRVLDSIGDLSPQDWERLAGSRSVFQERAWYESAPPPGRLRLLVAFRNGRAEAALPLHVVAEPPHYYHSPRALFCGFRERALFERVGRPTAALDRAERAEWVPALVSVSPYGYRGGLVAPPDCSAAVVAAVAQAVDELARRERVRIRVHHNLNEDDDGAWLGALRAQGTSVVVVGADCNLELPWRSVAEYFDALGPRGRRIRAAHRRALASSESIWRAESAATDGARAAASLFARTAVRHGDADPPAAFYERLLTAWPGSRLLLTGASATGELRSALLVLAKRRTLYPKLFGGSGRTGDYFFLTYSWLVEQALAQGATRIEYGGGGHEAKLLRGARLRWLLAGVRVYDRELERRLRDLLPLYEGAKVEHFGALAARYQTDHEPPSSPHDGSVSDR